MKIDRLTKKWIETPPAQWGQCLSLTGWQTADWVMLCDRLTSLSERAAHLAQYIETRTGADGCGLKDHDTAVKASNKRLIKVRTALGYSYPKAGIFSF